MDRSMSAHTVQPHMSLYSHTHTHTYTYPTGAPLASPPFRRWALPPSMSNTIVSLFLLVAMVEYLEYLELESFDPSSSRPWHSIHTFDLKISIQLRLPRVRVAPLAVYPYSSHRGRHRATSVNCGSWKKSLNARDNEATLKREGASRKPKHAHTLAPPSLPSSMNC